MRMHTARSQQALAPDQATAAWERRRLAAWGAYLHSVRDAAHADYEQVEQRCWEQLRRRLQRNDELLHAGPR